MKKPANLVFHLVAGPDEMPPEWHYLHGCTSRTQVGAHSHATHYPTVSGVFILIGFHCLSSSYVVIRPPWSNDA
jgi:hypothetical protein